MLIQENLSLQQKLEILADAAKYDVACTSSGVDRKGRKDAMGSAVSCGICHSFAADGRCVSLLKILLTNECIYDCKYCVNRISNDTVRTSFTPEEICTLTMEFYRRNYIEGLFLSSGILRTPDYTMEQIYQTLWQLREVHRFWGYIHVKEKKIFLPGTPESGGAPAKVKKKAGLPAPKGMLRYEEKSKFVPAGQSTQMIIGATPETDHQILSVTEALYHRFELKRVFFSAYTAINDDSFLPALGTRPPLLREHRLYQADWLLRFYGFEAGELLTEEKPYFNEALDPKCDWALRHLELFPVEVNRADYMTLLRVPGIGVKSAKRILQARRSAKLDFPDVKKFGVVLKRASYFITCGGKMMGNTPIEEDFLTRALTAEDRVKNQRIANAGAFRQMSLFEDFHVENPSPGPDDVWKSLSGQL